MTTPIQAPPKIIRALGYTRVSTDMQGESGLGLDAQQTTILAACQQRGWTLAEISTDVASGKSMQKRPSLEATLAALDRGDADALVVAKLDRLSRSLHDAAGLLRRAQQKGWSLVACDLGVDTTTSTGRLVAHVILACAEFEREQIGERTRDALAAAKDRGVKLGRPSGLPPETRRRITREHRAGRSYTAIARGLNEDGVPTGQGGKFWWGETVKRVLNAAAKPKRQTRPATKEASR